MIPSTSNNFHAAVRLGLNRRTLNQNTTGTAAGVFTQPQGWVSIEGTKRPMPSRITTSCFTQPHGTGSELKVRVAKLYASVPEVFSPSRKAGFQLKKVEFKQHVLSLEISHSVERLGLN